MKKDYEPILASKGADNVLNSNRTAKNAIVSKGSDLKTENNDKIEYDLMAGPDINITEDNGISE